MKEVVIESAVQQKHKELMDAINDNNIETVTEILKTEAGRKSLVVKGDIGRLPLHWAIDSEYENIVEEILKTEEGEKSLETLNNIGLTPLHVATRQGEIAVVKEMLETEEGKQIADDGGPGWRLLSTSQQPLSNILLNDALNNTGVPQPKPDPTTSTFFNDEGNNSASKINGLPEAQTKTNVQQHVLERSSNNERRSIV